MIQTQYFSYLKYNWISDDPRVHACAQMLSSERAANNNPLRNRGLDLSEAFNVILTSLEVCMGYRQNDSIHIAINQDLYTGNSKRNQTYSREIFHAIKFLIEAGYLSFICGVTKTKDKDGIPQWRPARYSFSEKWWSVIGVKPLSDPKLIRRNPLSAYVDLRHKVDGKSKSSNISPEIFAQNQELIENTCTLLLQYDELMRTVKIKAPWGDVYSARTSMTRIFNDGNFDLGGRFYCPIQSLKKEARRSLTFNGDPVVEIDYSSIHPNLLYQQNCHKFISPSENEDHYQYRTKDESKRDLVKKVFNLLLNRTGNKESEISSIMHHCKITKAEAVDLRDWVYELHKPVVHLFGKGQGIRLQRTDSDIAFKVIEWFVKNKRPIIMIHDSALVSVRDTENLKLLMFESYQEVIEKINPKAMLKGLKVESGDLTKQLEDAIVNCMNGTTEGFTQSYWDKLIAQHQTSTNTEEQLNEDLEESL
jgi:hypothetical protein